MFAPTSDFHDKIKDPSTYRQNLVLKFANGYFSGNDGDIEQGGVEFDEFFCTSEDLTYGECPSSSMRASIINIDQMLRTFTWGECEAYIGYLSASADVEVEEGVNAEYTLNSHTYTASENGFLIDGTAVSEEECHSLLAVDETDLYAFGNGYAYKVDLANATYSAYSPNRFMAVKTQTPRLIVWETDTDGLSYATVTHDGVSESWVYAPMGIYNVEKPKNLSGDVVDIDEAYDRMRLFDTDATDFLNAFSERNPDGEDQSVWLADLCNWVGVPLGEAPQIDTNNYSYAPNTAVTLREVLAWLAESYKGVFRFDREGYLTLYTVGTAFAEEVGIRRIEHSTLAVAEYVTRPVSKIINKNLSGLTYVTGSGDNAYYITGNPFVQDNSGLSLSDYGWYSYAPMSCVVLEADPLVDVGDAVGIWMSDEEYYAFVDAYNRIFVDEQGRVYTMTNTAVKMPLMHRILSWNGVCTATYEATGNKTRLVPSSMEQVSYNSNIANDTDNIINHIRVHGLEADWIKTGKLESRNGAYSLDMDNGTVNMRQATITGGGVDVETTEKEDAVVKAFYYGTEGGNHYETESTVSPYAVSSRTDYYSDSARTNKLFSSWFIGRSDAEGEVTVGFQRYGSSPVNGSVTIHASASDLNISFEFNEVERVYFGMNGIEFYDANGNLIKSL